MSDTHANRISQATQSLLGIHAIAYSLDREPTLVARLVSVAIQAVVLCETERTLNLIPLSDNDLAQLSDALDNLLDSDGLFRAVVGDSILYNTVFTDTRLLEEFGCDTNVTVLKITGLLDREHARFLKVTMANIQASQLPIDQRRSELERVESEQQALSEILHPINMGSGFSRATLYNDRTIVPAIVQKVGLAVERYRLKHGKLPGKLADLVPEFLEKLPDDPFTSKPLHYKKLDGGGFMIYSTGEDKTDDGGQRRNSKGEEFEPGSDLCFEIRR